MYHCYERHLPIRYNVWATKYNMEVTVMNKYVSLDKRSKKAQREYHAKQRRTWGDLNPVTRSVPSGKTYNRKKEKQRIGKEFRNGFDADLFLQNYMMPTASLCRKNCKAAKRQFQ